jgi:crossover junction endodeoxyribonuclease RuvC
MIYIGIDPGLNGAVGVIQEDTLIGPYGDIDVYSVFDTPTMVISGVKEKRICNAAAMAELLKPFARQPDVLVVLESVHSMPKQGVASSFSFGEGLGMWKGIIATLGLPLEMPSPQRWKKEMLADQGKDKDASRAKAIALFPSLATQLARKKDDGRAEAILMAEYGRRLRKGQ